MQETKGNLWDFHAAGNVIVVTTNGFVRKDGQAVMGRGTALQAAKKFPFLPKKFGDAIRKDGNHCFWFKPLRIITFPVKDHFYDDAYPQLIQRSVHELIEIVDRDKGIRQVFLPRPGTGNGHLNWWSVKPLLAPLDDRFTVVEYAE